MRLLNTETYELRTFLGEPPQYAILSHTWGEEEVTLADLGRRSRTKLQGWSKLVRCCRRAAADGWHWVWIDTCCIDKSNSSELSEAINSMFRWYEAAQICYAYLADVPPLPRGGANSTASRYVQDFSRARAHWAETFAKSRWFTRGWTLQELLAPVFLLFLDHDWGTIASREAMSSHIERATGIGENQLRAFRSCSVATKIAWAAGRRTTREEDRAYSLLGVLGVNMPLIYGEGRKAFVRLQHELIRKYPDESILAWGVMRE